LIIEITDGWNAVYFSNHSEANIFVKILSIVVLCLTLFMWTWDAGNLVLFEREQFIEKVSNEFYKICDALKAVNTGCLIFRGNFWSSLQIRSELG